MKKIFALMLLCLLLCAMSATAFAVKVQIFENSYDDAAFVERKATGSTYVLPEFKDVFTLPDGMRFVGWKFPSGFFYDEKQTVQVTDGMQIKAYLISDEAFAYNWKVVYLPGSGTGEMRFMPSDSGSVQLLGIDSFFDFKPPMKDGKEAKFLGWMVEGVYGYPPEYGDGVCWLFARAIAESPDEAITYRKKLVPADEVATTSLMVNGSGTLTVTAMWEGDDTQGGGGNTDPSTPKYNVKVSSSIINGSVSVSKTEAKEGDTVTITVTPDEGYGLSELNVSYSDGSQQVTVNNKSFTMPDSDVNVQATFVPRNQVIFNANGGACAVASATVNAENKLDELPEATREGYLFIGWFDDDEGGNPITKEMEFDQTQTTVYAQWCDAKHTTDPDKNDFNADIDMEDSDILNLLIDDDDKEKRKNILVYLTVEKEKEEDVPSDDKTAIVNKAGEDKIAAYLDIELFKQIGDDPPEKISNAGGKVHIKLMLEDALIPENAAKDSFYIIYYHDREAKRIDASFNVATKELTFDADKFSTYSLVYKTRTDENVTTSSLPKTGDDSMVALWSVMLALSAIAAAAVAKKRRAE